MSVSIDLPASSLVVYRLPSVLSRFPVPSRAQRSTSPRPYCFPVSSCAVRPTFPPRPCHFSASSRAVCPTLPFVRAVSVATCVTLSASLPVLPVSRSVPRRAFCAHRSFLFRWVLLYSTNHFALWRFVRQTVTLWFGLPHLCCVVACVCTDNIAGHDNIAGRIQQTL